MELAVFVVGALIVAAGAIGVVIMRNPVHCALSLVMTLFGVAVLFVQLDAHFLAVVQVIVYAGAIVILFLFVLMLLGVDRAEDLGIEPIKGQRPMALIVGVALIASALAVIVSMGDALTGGTSTTKELGPSQDNAKALGELLFTRYAFAFEITGLLLTIAVVAAVIFARKVKGDLQDIPPSALDEIHARTADAEEAKVDEGARGVMIVLAAAKPTIEWYLILGAGLFALGMFGMLTRRNPLVMFMCIELMLNAVNLTFVAMAKKLNDLGGQIAVFFVLVVAAAEVVVGLAIIVSILRRRPHASADDVSVLKG